MQKFIAIFSHVFYPLFIPVYATLFYFLLAGQYMYTQEIYLIFLQVFILTILLPVSVFYLLRSLGHIKTTMLREKRERIVPLGVYCLLLLMLIQYSFTGFRIPELYYFFLGLLLSNALAFILIIAGHKASLHMMAVSALTLFVISLSIYFHLRFIYIIAFFILSSGFVATSRLQVKAHSPYELILGTLVGIVPQVGLWFLWLLPTL